ncbi:hypothetical protein Rhopal_004002-T1 [Rhodotorula paludigena]|uniref:Betaine lipid synthase n=1 Tax=Rhodotorula paludigena TaxID=86838 RepID=A0AAV5GL95_9BASI|nr:hypothetical protein Rhopal_004002-T1 [Rhodotorula paludigena]
MATKALSLGAAGALALYFRPLRDHLTTYTQHPSASAWLLGSAIVLVAISAYASQLLIAVQFAWSCFFAPLGKNASQQGRLDRFYQGQAAIYDKTRAKLLRGRTTMLKLSAAHLKEQRRRNPNKRLVWLDIGGGTGWNVEEMDKYFPIRDFDAVYVLDLCGPLLEVSRKRFEARGWKKVHCLLQDATHFVLPEWDHTGLDGETGGLDFVTMSYSLSMMPDHLNLLDRVDRFLNPSGLFAVADFYVSARETTSVAGVIGDVASRQCSYWTRLFWLHWFELDHVDLHPSRRQYLEHRFATIKSYNARNGFILPGLISIPYYVSLHTSRRIDTSQANQAYEVDAGNTISASPSPLLMPTVSRQNSTADIPDLALGLSAALSRTRSRSSAAATKRPLKRTNSRSSEQSDSFRIDIAPELQLSSFHYGFRHHRVPFIDDPVHREFRDCLYHFAWEDPRVDVQHLKLTKDDAVMCITSGGENAMHYAIHSQPRRIHTVDMNPCQGHLMELKLAGIMALEYEEYWQLFGEGKHPNFRDLLDNKLSPFLTSHAYQYWRSREHYFDVNFYMRGYSGHALRLARWALFFAGVAKSTAKMCAAKDIVEQRRLWNTKIRPVLLSGVLTKIFFANPMFMWNALGVPMNQAKVFLKETSVSQFAADTFDPVALNTSIAQDNYFYQLCLQGKYTKDSCPEFLTRKGFEALKKNNAAALDCFRLHTDSINNVMRRLGPDSLTVAIIMDLQDWFDNTVEDPPAPGLSKKCELTSTIRTLHTALKPGGRVFFRSAGQEPWYLELYRREGFKVECVHKRPIGGKEPIDRVNMYASFYKCTKL